MKGNPFHSQHYGHAGLDELVQLNETRAAEFAEISVAREAKKAELKEARPVWEEEVKKAVLAGQPLPPAPSETLEPELEQIEVEVHARRNLLFDSRRAVLAYAGENADEILGESREVALEAWAKARKTLSRADLEAWADAATAYSRAVRLCDETKTDEQRMPRGAVPTQVKTALSALATLETAVAEYEPDPEIPGRPRNESMAGLGLR